jgi:hypothetical protein
MTPSAARRPAPDLKHHCLRLGIVQGGRLVEERVLPTHRNITVGWSPRSTFIVPSDGLPARWRLFEQHGGQRFLRLDRHMDARVAVADQMSTAPAGEPGGSAARLLPLPDGARGKITAGDVTILFQVLARPPAPPQPRLPVSVRGSLMTGLDRLFAAIAIFSFLCHLTMVLYLRSVDWPRRPDPETVPDRFITSMLKLPRVPPPRPIAVANADAKTPTKPTTARAPASKPVADKPTVSSEERRRLLLEQVRNTVMLKHLTALGGDSPMADLLKPGDVDRAQEEAFRGVSGVSLAAADTLRGLSPGKANGGKLVTIDGLRGVGGIAGPPETSAIVERRPPIIRVDAPTVEDGSGHVDPSLLAREIRARISAIRACYERALKRTPTLGGKLVLRFTITAAGTVSAVDVDDDTLHDEEVVSCLKSIIARWRFPAPAGGAVELTFPFIFAPAM